MTHQTEIIEHKIISDGALAIRVRCCGDETTDSWHTLYVSASQTDDEITKWTDERKAAVADMHGSRQKAESAIARLIKNN